MRRTYTIHEGCIDAAGLQLADSVIRTEYSDSSLSAFINSDYTQVKSHIETIIKPRYGYVRVPAEQVQILDGKVVCGTQLFLTEKIISSALANTEELILFLVTIGSEAEALAHNYMAEADYLRGYLTDILASAYTEAAAQWLEEHLVSEEKNRGNTCTLRFSPGYCGWNVAEQEKLFSFFPKGFCGVRLAESALMIPLKSISGILGTGPAVIRKDYACNVCESVHCLRYKQ